MEVMTKCIIGSKIFIKDKNKVWICAEIIKEEDSNIIVKTEDCEIVTLSNSDDYYLRNIDIYNSSGLCAPNDLTELTHLHEASVLHSLNVRFDVDEIYTFTGPILIAINPFKKIDNLYNDNILEKYIKNNNIYNINNINNNEKLKPHIFYTSNNAYLGLCKNNKSQTILISGESGAGKTESTKYVMKFLASAGTLDNKRSLIENQVLESNPLLESFGNARTLRNDNSSRFGKYIELQFNNDKANLRGILCGAKISTYLLEKVRVCDQQEGERNYHIFYQLCKAVEQSKKNNGIYHFPSCEKFKNKMDSKELKIDFNQFETFSHFKYLTKSTVHQLNDVDDIEEFEATVYAMQIIGINEEEQYEIFKVLEGILHIGNILFNTEGGNMDLAEISPNSMEDLKKVTYFLDVDEEQLKNALCYKTIVANNEHYKTPINPTTAAEIRDALTRAIYGCLFLKVVERTNQSIGYDENVNLFCGVLDIFGFESFPYNSFEQLCINYTNERLQQYFNNFIFKCEEKLYIQENIKWDPLDFPDNQDCVDILESKPYGIFCMLDEECQIPLGKDKTFCSKIINKHKDNKRFNINKTNPNAFMICHFAGKVNYLSNGFLEKNKDQLSVDAQNALLNSKNKYISKLFETYLRINTEKKKFTTVSSEFRQQLNILMQRIKETETHFIRCIKPNSQNIPDVFDRTSVNEQLKYGGVLQAVKVSRAGYPVRLSHKDCVNDYVILLNKTEKKIYEEKYKEKTYSEKATYILNQLYKIPIVQEYALTLKKFKEQINEYELYKKKKLSTNEINTTKTKNENENNFINNEESYIWAVGKTMCFFKSDIYNILSTLRSDFRSEQAIIIQKNYKCYSQKKMYNLMKVKAVILQKWFRNLLELKRKKQIKINNAKELISYTIYGYIIRKKFLHKRKCAILIQARIRGILTRKLYKEYRKQYYAIKIQSFWRGMKVREHYKKLKKVTVQIQLRWKRVLARRQLKRLKEEAKEVGSLLAKNQMLTKELNEIKSKKEDVESKLLKALATIDKLTNEVATLEKIKKENEECIKKLKEQNSIKTTNNVNLNYKNSTLNKIGKETTNVNDSDLKSKDKIELINKIKKLELQNKDYMNQNDYLNERYTKLLNIVSQLKDKSILNELNNNVNNKYNTSLNNNYLSKSIKMENDLEKKHIYKRNEQTIDILLCGPKNVGKTSLLEDLFVRLGDEVNLKLLRKNKKNVNKDANEINYNTYNMIYKNMKIKAVDYGYVLKKNLEEYLFYHIKNAFCIVVVFDPTNEDSINPALHLLQEASILNVKKDKKLYLLENIFNEKINMNMNINDVTSALKVAKSCNALYVKKLDLFDILNDYTNEILMNTNNLNKENNFNDNILDQTKNANTENFNYAFKINELISKFEKYAESKNNNTVLLKGTSKSLKKEDTSYYSNKNAVHSMVNSLRTLCGFQNNKINQNIQLLRESIPANNYIYNNTNKKINNELGKGLQPICEITIENSAPITYMAIGQDLLHKDYILLAVGDKKGYAFIYKVYKTTIEININENELLKDDKTIKDDKIRAIQVKKNVEELENLDKNNKNEIEDPNYKSIKLHSKLTGHKKAITWIAFTYSENKIITSSIDKCIRVWEVDTGFPLKVFSDSSATLTVLLFPTNPDIFICSNCNSLLRLVNLHCGQLYQKIKLESEVRALEIDDTGLNIFAGSKNGTIHILEVVYSECIQLKFRFHFSSASITCIKFVSRTSLKTLPCIFVNSCDNHIGIIDCIYGNKGILTNLSVRSRIRINHEVLPIRNTYSYYGGGWLISGSEDRNIYICSLSSNLGYKPILLKHHKAPVMSVVVNSMDTLMVSADTKGVLVFWRRTII